MRRDMGKTDQGRLNPSEYMNISKQSYYQEFERPKGSIYTQTLATQQATLEGDEQVKRGDRTKAYLRGLSFSFIRDSYNRNMQSASSKRGARIAMYAVPGLLAFGLAVWCVSEIPSHGRHLLHTEEEITEPGC